MTHIPIQAIGNYNTLWFWYMVPEPHGCLYIEIYFLIILFQVTIYFQYVHDYFNVHLRCCVLCHYDMFYGRLPFYCILILYAKFFMFTLFLLYLVRNDNNKDDQSIDIMSAMASQIIAFSIIYSTVCSGADKKIIKARRPRLYDGNSPVSGEFPAQRTSNAENVSIWWRNRVS